jgi:hypothetical protein
MNLERDSLNVVFSFSILTAFFFACAFCLVLLGFFYLLPSIRDCMISRYRLVSIHFCHSKKGTPSFCDFLYKSSSLIIEIKLKC